MTAKTASTFKIVRYWEVDTIRGLAIILMVYYHLMWNLTYFGVVQFSVTTGVWKWFARSIGATFIFVLGVSLVLSYQRTGRQATFQKYLLRGSKVFTLGLVITLATYFLFAQGFVVFGILHLLGFAIIATYPFLVSQQRWLTLNIGLLIIAVGIYLNDQAIAHPWLIWLGVKQIGRSMVDYYPVLPWLGVALLGIVAGYTLYPKGNRIFTLPDQSDNYIVGTFSFLGRHSLLIYLIHQPVLNGLLTALGIGSL